MARKVDFIIDMDGGVLHRYLPEKFNRNNYVIWRVSCINPETYKLQKVKTKKTLAKIILKNLIRKIVFHKKDIPKGIRIYPIDEWTRKELIKFWKVNPEKRCLYPDIKTDRFNPHLKKINKMVVLGRIAPNKSINDSIRIFEEGTRKHKEYTLEVMGGVTPDSEVYINYLKELIVKLGLEKRVKIIKDPSSEKIQEALSESKVVIDSQKGVSITLTAIEALASGCVVLAYKNAGTFKEILENGKYGYGFVSIAEGAEELKKIIDPIGRKKGEVKKLVQRADFFSTAKFYERVNLILNEA